MLVRTHSPQFEDWFVELGEPMDRYELPAVASEEKIRRKRQPSRPNSVNGSTPR